MKQIKPSYPFSFVICVQKTAVINLKKNKNKGRH